MDEEEGADQDENCKDSVYPEEGGKDGGHAASTLFPLH